jgi:hypothetical protein
MQIKMQIQYRYITLKDTVTSSIGTTIDIEEQHKGLVREWLDKEKLYMTAWKLWRDELISEDERQQVRGMLVELRAEVIECAIISSYESKFDWFIVGEENETNT